MDLQTNRKIHDRHSDQRCQTNALAGISNFQGAPFTMFYFETRVSLESFILPASGDKHRETKEIVGGKINEKKKKKSFEN